MSESEDKTEAKITKEEWSLLKAFLNDLDEQLGGLEDRVIALERGLEGVLRRMEESGQPDDQAGWYGRPE